MPTTQDAERIYDIAIIGLGANGIAVLQQLHEAQMHVNVAVVNNAQSFSRGLTFGDAAGMHRVNTQPEFLSLSHANARHFIEWAADTPEIECPPRTVVASYLSEHYRHLRQHSKINITEFREDAIAVKQHAHHFTITTTHHSLSAAIIILCLGAPRNELFPYLSKAPGYISHFEHYRPDNTFPVLVAGSSLSAVDAYRYIHAHNRDVEVHLFSRHGYAPTCLSAAHRYQPRYLTQAALMDAPPGKTLAVFLRLIKQEFKRIGRHNEFLPAMRLLATGRQNEYFHYLRHRAEQADLPWQDTLVSMRYYLRLVWKKMTLDEKRHFSRTWGSLWAVWSHSVPITVFEQLEEGSRHGTLHVHAATARPRIAEGHFVLNDSLGDTVRAPLFWDATGGSNTVEQMDSPLIQSLLAERLIAPHDCGGIEVNPDTLACRVNGADIPNLYSIGPLNKGATFSTNALWFNIVWIDIMLSHLKMQYTSRA